MCCYLMHAKIVKDTEAALKYFGDARTSDGKCNNTTQHTLISYNKIGKGVTIPSQKRYIKYYEKILKTPDHKLPTPQLYIKRVHMSTIPTFLKGKLVSVIYPKFVAI